MNKIALALVATLTLAACSEEPPMTEFEQQRQLLLIQQQHALEMKKQEVAAIAAANQQSHTYIENEYEYEIEEAPAPIVQTVPQPVAAPVEEGYSGTDMLLAAGAGMAAGYVVGELLDSGYSKGTDSNGNVRYYDSNKREVSQGAYEENKRKHPIKAKAQEMNQKAKNGIQNAKTKTKEKSNEFKSTRQRKAEKKQERKAKAAAETKKRETQRDRKINRNTNGKSTSKGFRR